MNHPTFAIIDDDRELCRFMASVARDHGFQPRQLHSVAEATSWLSSHSPDLALLDIGLPDGCGLDLLEQVAPDERSRFVFLSGTSDPIHIRRAATGHAQRFIAKPIAMDILEGLLSERIRALGAHPSHRQIAYEGMIGDSAAMQQLRTEIEQVATSDLNVLICGESGTGKELVAQAIHRRSGRKGRMVAVNCGAIPPELLPSQLFGHERGSFTGASSKHVGYLEQADGGTLFLDEIGEMPPMLQVHLLRALETNSIVRVGGTTEIPINVRILAATNRSPPSQMLRQDLFYRLSHYLIQLAPLRERGDDMRLLVHHFIQRLQPCGMAPPHLDPAGLAALHDYHWPGNVRELLAATKRALLMNNGQPLRIAPLLPHSKPTQMLTENLISFPIGTSIQEAQDEIFRRTLDYHGGDRTAAARSLGVSVRTIHNYLARVRRHE